MTTMPDDHSPARGPAYAMLATELSTLLQRLGIPAMVCDGAGAVLAATADAGRIASARRLVDVRVVDLALCGQAFCVTAREDRSDGRDLTRRQQAVVELLAEGLEYDAIGQRLGISTHTARRHTEAVMQRLGVRTRPEAVRMLRHLRAAERAFGGRNARVA